MATNVSTSSWCFTINNYTDKDLEYLQSYFIHLCTVLFASFEVGECGTPHVQGYFILKRNKRLTGLKKLFGDHVHFEKAKGDKDDNLCYVFKDGSTPFIKHDNGGRGKRNDITDFLEDVESNGKRKAVAKDPATYVKYHKGLDKAWAILHEPELRTDYPEVYWVYGPSGIGKTGFGASTSYVIINNYPWFDGYLDQETVILDEIDKAEIPLRVLLQLTDRYDIHVQVKGSTVRFNPPRIVITSSVHPKTLYPDTEWQQIRRRLKNVGTKNVVGWNPDGTPIVEGDWIWEFTTEQAP